jgi:peroxiredoxin
VLVKGLFQGELGSFMEGPVLDADAPDFELKTHDGDRTIRLSDYRHRMPVVLIFGSFT